MFSSLLLSFSLVLTQESAAFGKPTVRFEYDTGAEWWTVKVRNYSAVKLLDRIATLTARSIEGREFLEGAPLITVDLDRRSLDQVLEFALGSVDLRHDLRRDLACKPLFRERLASQQRHLRQHLRHLKPPSRQRGVEDGR